MKSEKFFTAYTVDNEITQRREYYSYYREPEFISRELIDSIFDGCTDSKGIQRMLQFNIRHELIGRWGKYRSRNINEH